MPDKEFKIIELKSGKKILTVNFRDKGYELLGTLFSADVSSFGDWIKENINDVLQGKADKRDISGNVCELVIDKDNTVVYDMLAEDGTGNRCTVPTRELLSLIYEWQEKKAFL